MPEFFDTRYKYFALPRLYVEADLSDHCAVSLGESQTHYLKNVMRKGVGDQVRLFNGRDGEWLARIVGVSKRALDLEIIAQIATQPRLEKAVHLFFAPLKKDRMDILIEKAVELGVTDLHPIITRRSDVRKVNEKRVRAQILEAAEQCERFTIPRLHALLPLEGALQAHRAQGQRLYFCSEHGDDPHIGGISVADGQGFIIGPPGGFDPEEVALALAFETVVPISLGATIYRAETAALVCLVHAHYTLSS